MKLNPFVHHKPIFPTVYPLRSGMVCRFLTQLTCLLAVVVCGLGCGVLRADDGYRAWLRYDPLDQLSQRQAWTAVASGYICREDDPSVQVALEELMSGLGGLLGIEPEVRPEVSGSGGVLIGTIDGNPEIAVRLRPDDADQIGSEGYVVRTYANGNGKPLVMVAARSGIGVLYGVFDLLRQVQTGVYPYGLDRVDQPKIGLRMLNHWDNLNRTVERGYAGFSLWEWFELPDYISPRYRDYARLCASVGINASVLTNVNANAVILTEPYLEKVAALADVFRPYGVRVYLTARFSAPMEIGGLETADPLDPQVAGWWKQKVEEIYRHVPDFGGFLVKANSEGQPGPQDYGRSHADGANMMADALAPHGGTVMWRAFVYAAEVEMDRAMQAYAEFQPLDGTFRPNVFVQIKNGAIDFMPTEPFHPLFGAMPKTRQTLELQITQEYLGASIHLAYLAPMWKQCLDADTRMAGAGTTVAKVIAGSNSADGYLPGAIAGVANTGTNRNWTGHPLAAANWYAFGRLAWNPDLSPESVAEEWVRMTFSNDASVVESLRQMLMESHPAVVDYMMPLGLHHIMAWDHHYGPGPWIDQGRPDWTAVYYHKADKDGIGFDRTASGSGAVQQYHPDVAGLFADANACPDRYLLWFHHMPWDHPMPSGNNLWDEICLRYQRGVDTVGSWLEVWSGLKDSMDAQRHDHVMRLLTRQERESRWWRDACLSYFQTFSNRPLPEGVGVPEHDLEYYRNLRLRYVPGTPSEQ